MSRGYLAKFKSVMYGTSNTTITHYSPIESSMNSVNDFVVGSPVYMTGKVYKHSSIAKQGFVASPLHPA